MKKESQFKLADILIKFQRDHDLTNVEMIELLLGYSRLLLKE